ncbi:MAG: glycosyl hydrolase, partial [Acidimicrobiales bacterium]
MVVAALAAAVLPAQAQAGAGTRSSVAASISTAAQPAPPHGPVFLPDDGALFGSHVPADAHTGPDRRTAVQTFEANTGRVMALERVFYRWDAVFPNADDEWSRDQGRTLVMSWNTGRADGTFVKWADIAAGVYDVDIDAKAAALKAFGAPLVFVFNHEPNNGNNTTGEKAGTPEEFQAAFRYIHDRFLANEVTNVSFGLVLMAITFKLAEADRWYPGDAYVDILGADGYNWYGCNGFGGSPWANVRNVFTDFHDYGVAHNKAMIVAEWASGEDPLDPNRKAQWIRDGAATWKSWPEIKGVSWFNTGTNPGCPRYVDTTPESLAAYVEIGADPYFNPTAVVSITDGPPSVTDATAATFSFSSSRADASFACSLDGAPQEPCASPYSLTGIDSGSRRLEVRATDAAGGFGNPTAWSWQVTGPVTTIQSGPAATTT